MNKQPTCPHCGEPYGDHAPDCVVRSNTLRVPLPICPVCGGYHTESQCIYVTTIKPSGPAAQAQSDPALDAATPRREYEDRFSHGYLGPRKVIIDCYKDGAIVALIDTAEGRTEVISLVSDERASEIASLERELAEANAKLHREQELNYGLDCMALTAQLAAMTRERDADARAFAKTLRETSKELATLRDELEVVTNELHMSWKSLGIEGTVKRLESERDEARAERDEAWEISADLKKELELRRGERDALSRKLVKAREIADQMCECGCDDKAVIYGCTHQVRRLQAALAP